MCIPYINPLNSFIFLVFSNSRDVCNLTMKHLFLFVLNFNATDKYLVGKVYSSVLLKSFQILCLDNSR